MAENERCEAADVGRAECGREDRTDAEEAGRLIDAAGGARVVEPVDADDDSMLAVIITLGSTRIALQMIGVCAEGQRLQCESAFRVVMRDRTGQARQPEGLSADCGWLPCCCLLHAAPNGSPSRRAASERPHRGRATATVQTKRASSSSGQRGATRDSFLIQSCHPTSVALSSLALSFPPHPLPHILIPLLPPLSPHHVATSARWASSTSSSHPATALPTPRRR